MLLKFDVPSTRQYNYYMRCDKKCQDWLQDDNAVTRIKFLCWMMVEYNAIHHSELMQQEVSLRIMSANFDPLKNDDFKEQWLCIKSHFKLSKT
jgi:hypothetical protein